MQVKEVLKAIEEENGSNCLSSLLRDAATNPEIRKAFIQDPYALLSERVGTPFPKAIKIVLHENTENTVHISLPADPENLELSDTALNKVSGGQITALQWLTVESQLVQAGVIGGGSDPNASKPAPNNNTPIGMVLHNFSPEAMKIGGYLAGIALSIIPGV